jgi:hypothetical protein
MDTKSKPKLPTGTTYRDPATGRFIKREEGETRVRTGGSVQVGTGGAVSNDDVMKFIQSLAQQKFKEGMAASFNQPAPESDMKREEFAKLFDTITNKVISKLGSVNSTLLELKKSNNEQGTRLINLSTSMFSAISSQKDTIDELYKIIDTRLAELVGKDSKNDAKDSGSDKQSFRTAGLIRGIAGLNKQIVELNKTVSSKVVPLLSSINEKISVAKISQAVVTATPQPTAAKPVEETEKIAPASTKDKQKKDEKSSYTMSKLEMLGDGLTKLLGGGVLIGLGASLNDLSKNIANLPETIGNIIKEKAESTTKNVAKSGMETILSPMTGDNFFKQNPEWFDEYTSRLGKTGSDIGSMTSTASDAIFKSDISPFSAQGYEKDLKELDAVFGQVSSIFKLFVDDISHIKKYAEESGLFDSIKSMVGITSDKKPDSKISKENKKPGFVTPVEKTNSQIKPKEVIKRAKPKLRNQPIGEFSIVNTASTQNIESNIVKPLISPITQSIQNASSTIEESKSMNNGNNVQQQQSPVVINNSTNNNQSVGLLHSPSPRNTETSKQLLDRLMLYGNYTGTGFLMN